VRLEIETRELTLLIESKETKNTSKEKEIEPIEKGSKEDDHF